MSGLYTFTLYGADGQPEQDALKDAVDDCLDEEIDIDAIVCLPLAQAPHKAVRHALADDSANKGGQFNNHGDCFRHSLIPS